MKLKELLNVIPDTYLLGLTNADEENYSILHVKTQLLIEVSSEEKRD